MMLQSQLPGFAVSTTPNWRMLPHSLRSVCCAASEIQRFFLMQHTRDKRSYARFPFNSDMSKLIQSYFQSAVRMSCCPRKRKETSSS
eukprot:6151478-Amphidinium_carterae.2